MTNHVHAVVSAPECVKPEKIVADFKAWTTRRLRETALVPIGVPIWSEGSSTRYLWNRFALDAACHYVRNQIEEETQQNPKR